MYVEFFLQLLIQQLYIITYKFVKEICININKIENVVKIHFNAFRIALFFIYLLQILCTFIVRLLCFFYIVRRGKLILYIHISFILFIKI